MLAGEVWRPGCAQPKISGDFRQQRDVIYDFQFRLFDMVYLDEPFNLQPYHVRLDRYRALAHADTGVAPGDATEISYAKPVMLRAGQTPEELAREMGDGYDGVVVWDLHSIPVWDEKARMGQAIKFKPNITVDVRCTGGIQGEGKHAGRLGALTYTTADGKTGSVGTGFSDEQRKTFWDALRLGLGVAGDIFEVEAMGRTPDGNLREPRFKGFRFDKTESD
jgi:DNA ligase-1